MQAVGESPPGPDEVQRAACDLPRACHLAVLLVVDADNADRLAGLGSIGDEVDEVGPPIAVSGPVISTQ